MIDRIAEGKSDTEPRTSPTTPGAAYTANEIHAVKIATRLHPRVMSGPAHGAATGRVGAHGQALGLSRTSHAACSVAWPGVLISAGKARRGVIEKLAASAKRHSSLVGAFPQMH